MDASSPTHNIGRLLAIMARLRDPADGCPWDVAQSFRTIAPYTIEEAYEVAEAIERNDLDSLKDELGDLLFQVVFHARMAEESGAFEFADVAEAVCDKMVRRHPHVFGDTVIANAEVQTRHWEDLKAAERARRAALDGEDASVLAGVALGLPALLRAVKLQKRAARVGFDWPEPLQVFAKIDEELSEIKGEMAAGNDPDRLTDEIGDLLFAVVNLARHLDVDPEGALRHGNAKFERRFRKVEQSLANKLESVSLDEMEAAWRAAKQDED